MRDLIADLQSRHSVVVIVGHNISAEIASLDQIGWYFPHGAAILDTHTIWMAANSAARGGSLGAAIHSYGIPIPGGGNPFHNAGNDAHFTMELLIHKAEKLMADESFTLATRPALPQQTGDPKEAYQQKRKRVEDHNTVGTSAGDKKRRALEAGAEDITGKEHNGGVGNPEVDSMLGESGA